MVNKKFVLIEPNADGSMNLTHIDDRKKSAHVDRLTEDQLIPGWTFASIVEAYRVEQK